MIEAEIPHNEAKRLEALQRLSLLDSLPEERFDRIVAIAQELFDTPVALISLIDAERQWFKSRDGISQQETPRAESFCAHAVAADTPLIIENALEDQRFCNNPLVTGEFGLRFYAGHPIHSPEGYPLGALCVIDHKPRLFSEKNQELLRTLAEAVDEAIASRRARNYFPKVIERQRFGAFMQGIGSRLSRQSVSLGIAASLFAGLIMLMSSQYVQSLESDYLQDRASISSALYNLRGRMETELNARLHLTHGLSGFVRAGPKNIDRQAFLSFAQDLGSSIPGIRSVQLAPDAIVTYIWPEETNSPALGHQLLADPKRKEAAELAIKSRKLWVAGPHELIQGGTALIGRLPIFLPHTESEPGGGSDIFWGFATVLVDLDNLLRISELDYLSDKAPVAIRGYNGLGSDGRVFVGPSDLFEGEHLTASVALPEGSWEVGVAIPPAPSFHDLPGYIWGLIVSAALLISTLLYLLLRLPFRYQQAVDNAKNDLSQSNARFKDAIESLPDGLSVFDSNDRLIRCNRKYREFFASENIPVPLGLSFEELLRDGIASGHYLFPDIKASTREAFFAKRMSHHLNPTPEGIEIHIADGRCLRAQESRIPSGGTVVAYSDVSELKNKEHELANAKKKAETANEAKTAFLATVSHELRTPLNAILGLLNLVQMSGRLEKTDQNFIDVTYESAEHLLNLLNELLDLSKMESNKLELESNTFNLACITRKAITLCANRADQKEISLIEDVDDTADVMVIGDAGRLQQILLNLISNSLKFSDQGLVTVSVEKTKNLNDEMWFCFRVVDTGIGFTDAQAKSLFQPFSQLDSTASRKHEGTGLGLAICKRLVELMGGKIWAQGELGKGATFEFEIPFLASANNDKDEAISMFEEATPLNFTDRPVRVLIAEDSPANQMVFRAMLEDTGYVVDIVGNGLEAVTAANAFDYDVILMDIFMPEMDGLKATQAIRQSGRMNSKPIIALTANAMPGDREKFIGAGMDDYLAKPVNKNTLLKMLNRWSHAKA
jgi:hypothetical protein